MSVAARDTDDDIDATITAATEAMDVYKRAIDAGGVDGLLRGRPVAPAVRRLAQPRQLVDV